MPPSPSYWPKFQANRRQLARKTGDKRGKGRLSVQWRRDLKEERPGIGVAAALFIVWK
jgi:hypothetical protein